MKKNILKIARYIYQRGWLMVLGISFIGFALISAITQKEDSLTCTCGSLIGVQFAPDVPGDNKLVTGQTQANCFAWWEFVSLNWPTDHDALFGEPGNTGLVQWETYMPRSVLLPPNGKRPPPWGANSRVPVQWKHLIDENDTGKKILFSKSKFNSQRVEVIDEDGQAFPQKKPNWLGAQNQTNLWYEVLVNKDEYNYIVENQFYNANKQYEFVSANKDNVIKLPEGSSSQVGSIELKATWLEVTNPEAPKWNRYKLSKAILIEPETGTKRESLVALIGLHILHKTESQPTWFWATFDHIDNVPLTGQTTGDFNLYSAECQPKTVTVPVNCGKNTNSSEMKYTVDCVPNTSPPYYLCSNVGPVPIQVIREIPIDTQARKVNQQLQEFIQKNFPGSVWSNYQLINMIWSTTPQNSQTNKTPQGVKSMQPVIPVSNPASETYIQSVTCFNCHKTATIASTLIDLKPKFASDFSFIFEFATYPE